MNVQRRCQPLLVFLQIAPGCGEAFAKPGWQEEGQEWHSLLHLPLQSVPDSGESVSMVRHQDEKGVVERTILVKIVEKLNQVVVSGLQVVYSVKVLTLERQHRPSDQPTCK